jgi:hypothetical protein
VTNLVERRQMPERAAGFFIAPFGVDGEPEGFEYVELGRLSGKWLTIVGEHLREHGASFDVPWSGNLSHIRTKFTSASGVALVTFRVGSQPAASVALASGRAADAESEVLRMFIDSLRRVHLVGAAAASAEPFAKVTMIAERPVMIVVPWPDSAISQQDHSVVRELSLHLAGAFFAQVSRPT